MAEPCTCCVILKESQESLYEGCRRMIAEEEGNQEEATNCSPLSIKGLLH